MRELRSVPSRRPHRSRSKPTGQSGPQPRTNSPSGSEAQQAHLLLTSTRHRESCTDHNSSPRPFRILWGTQHSIQESDVRCALHAAGPIPESVSIRKTVKKSHNSTAWWFTIFAEEDYISIVDLHWAQISQDPRWVLLKQLKRHQATKTAPQAVYVKPHPQPCTQESQSNSATSQEKAVMAQPPAQELPYPSCHPLLGVGNHHSPDSPHQQGAQLSHPHDRLKQTHPHLAPTSRRDSCAGHNSSPRPFQILWGTQHSTQESDIRRALHAVGQIPESASIRKTV